MDFKFYFAQFGLDKNACTFYLCLYTEHDQVPRHLSATIHSVLICLSATLIIRVADINYFLFGSLCHKSCYRGVGTRTRQLCLPVVSSKHLPAERISEQIGEGVQETAYLFHH
jgi:hypothetical protein